MNSAFVQRDPKRPSSAPAHVAAEGLGLLGYEVIWFDEADAQNLDVTADTLVVGFIEVVRRSVERITGTPPPVINYPEPLMPFAGRRVWDSTVRQVVNDEAMWPVFVKPAGEIKSFGGRIVCSVRDLVAMRGLASDTPVHCSDLVRFLSEYRCFVKDREVLGVRHYKGDPLVFPDPARIVDMVRAWTDAPRAYCLDVGVVEDGADGATVLVEVNDAYSAGTYGLEPIIYARFVEARWCEMTGATPIP